MYGDARYSLGANDAHLWYSRTDDCASPERLAAYRALLSEEEAARLARFAFEPLQREYLVARALCRHSLSLYADVRPRDWRFATNAFGRPHVAAAPGTAPLYFNLSHSRSLVACVVTRFPDVGVDVEETDREVEEIEIAERFFSAEEAASLRGLSPDARRRRFYALWTLKEAYVKALGTGLSTGLRDFSVRLGDTTTPTLCFHDPSLGAASAWQLALLAPTRRHALAVCLRTGETDAVRLRVREVVPGDAA